VKKGGETPAMDSFNAVDTQNTQNTFNTPKNLTQLPTSAVPNDVEKLNNVEKWKFNEKQN